VICPRCCKYELTAHPALSRADNKTEVCPICGTDEAMVQYSDPKHEVQPVVSWPVALQFEQTAVEANPSVRLAS
jgi:hypothetical protein